MSEQLVKEIWAGRTGSFTAKGVRDYQRIWEVVTVNQKLGPQAAVALVGISLGDTYTNSGGTETDSGSTCQSIDPVNDSAAPYYWKITYKYSTHGDVDKGLSPGSGKPGEQQSGETQPGQGQGGNPTDEGVKVTYSFQLKAKTIEKDLDGVPILNTAGDKFDPGATQDIVYTVASCRKKVPTFDTNNIPNLIGKVNAEPWRGCPPGWAKIVGINAENGRENNVDYVMLTVDVIMAPEDDATGFEFIRPLDAGYRQIINGKRVAIIDRSNGQKPNGPVPLNGFGVPITIAGVGQEFYHTYRVARATSFAGLGL